MKRRPLTISPVESRELLARAHEHGERPVDAKRAKLILLLAEGKGYEDICQALGCSTSFISRWKHRFLSGGLAGLYPRYRDSETTRLTPQLEAHILAWTRRTPTDGSKQWSTRRLARQLGINHMLVHRAWRRAGYRPPELDDRAVSEAARPLISARDVVGLFLHPPRNAVIFCAGQTLAGGVSGFRRPSGEFPPANAERFGALPRNHGAHALSAALKSRDGQLDSATTDGYSSSEFVAFLEDLVAHRADGQVLQVITDSFSMSNARRVRDFRSRNPVVHMESAPTHTAWLFQIALMLSKIGCEAGFDTQSALTKSLAEQLFDLIGVASEQRIPFRWRYRFTSMATRSFGSDVTTW